MYSTETVIEYGKGVRRRRKGRGGGGGGGAWNTPLNRTPNFACGASEEVESEPPGHRLCSDTTISPTHQASWKSQLSQGAQMALADTQPCLKVENETTVISLKSCSGVPSSVIMFPIPTTGSVSSVANCTGWGMGGRGGGGASATVSIVGVTASLTAM